MPKPKWLWGAAVIVPAVLWIPWLLLARRGAFPATAATASGLVAALTLLVSVYTDLRWRKIPNWATYSAFLWIWVLQSLAALMPPEVTLSLGDETWAIHEQFVASGWKAAAGGVALALSVMVLIAVIFRGGGGGDIKLLAVLGGLLGADRVLPLLVYSYLAAGLFAACYFVIRIGPMGLLAALLSGLGLSRADRLTRHGEMLKHRTPMAPFFAVGALLTQILD